MDAKKKIEFTTFEESEELVRNYSRKLTPEDRLRLLTQLRLRAFGKHLLQKSTDRKIYVYQKEPLESLEEFFKRIENRHL